jgi:hypothetical protein
MAALRVSAPGVCMCAFSVLRSASFGATIITRKLLFLRSRRSCRGCVIGGWRRIAALILGVAVMDGSVQASAQVLTPSLLPGNVLLANPLSGLYGEVTIANKTRRFQPANPRFVDTAPVAGRVLNLYGRLSWDLLEPAEGHYMTFPGSMMCCGRARPRNGC